MSQPLRSATDLASFLELEYQERYAKNPRYSYRAYARDLTISPSYLSEVLKGGRGFSPDIAVTVSKALKLNSYDEEFFISLVQSQFGRTFLKRKTAKERLKVLREKWNPQKVSSEVFKVVADWYHMAILEMVQLKGFKANGETVSKRLGISEQSADEAIERIVEFGLAERVGHSLKVSDIMTVGDNVPSMAIRSFHSQVIEKAQESIEGQGVEQRVLSSNFFAIDEQDIPRARAAIQEFVETFAADFSVGGKKDRLYALSLQFFDLEKKEHS